MIRIRWALSFVVLTAVAAISSAAARHCHAAQIDSSQLFQDFRCMHFFRFSELDGYYGGCGYPMTSADRSPIGMASGGFSDRGEAAVDDCRHDDRLYDFGGERSILLELGRLATPAPIQGLPAPLVGQKELPQPEVAAAAAPTVSDFGVLGRVAAIVKEFTMGSDDPLRCGPRTGYDRLYDELMSKSPTKPIDASAWSTPDLRSWQLQLQQLVSSAYDWSRQVAQQAADSDLVAAARRAFRGDYLATHPISIEPVDANEVSTGSRQLFLKAADTLDQVGMAITEAAGRLRAWAEQDGLTL